MVAIDEFRHNLAALLAECAAVRAYGSSARDRQATALLLQLATDAPNLDPHVFVLCQLLFTHDDLTARFRRRFGDLLAEVGTTVRPADSSDLVRWMLGRVMADAHEPLNLVKEPRMVSSVSRMMPPNRVRFQDLSVEPPSVVLTFVGDFAAGIGIVGPMLAVYEVAQGIGQWRERAGVAGHPATSATVLATGPDAGGRSVAAPATVTLLFSPGPGAPPCRAMVHLTHVGPPLAVGDAVMVAPRSAACEAPLVLSQLGSPMASFAVAVALLACGLGALRVWDRVWQRGHRVPLGKVWASTVAH